MHKSEFSIGVRTKQFNFANLKNCEKNYGFAVKFIVLLIYLNFSNLKKIGFLFGSEASGLSNNEISYANYTLQIPTNPDFKSLNLSHS